MRWVLPAVVVACGALDTGQDAGNGSDATVDACGGFDCADSFSSFDVTSAPLPTPVLCPSTPPVEGTTCSVPDYQDCEYGTKDYFCNDHFECFSGHWSKNTYITKLFCGVADACDTIVDGGACHALGQVCPAGDASICVCSECGAGPPPPPPPGDAAPYQLSFWSCFSPNDGCSVQRPNVGGTCDIPDGSLCRYTYGGCCTGVFEACVSGVWIGEQTEPCP